MFKPTERKLECAAFSPTMIVYYIRPNGATGCSTTVKDFEQHKEKYKDCLLVIAPANAPVYFRKV
jgi:hypothetical protein